MGKKHKKHKSERRHDDDGEEKPHLKIVLKLGGEPGVYDSDYAASSPSSYAGEYTIDNDRSHKKKKKKRRHNSGDQEHRLKIKKVRREPEFEPQPADDDPKDLMEVPPLSPDDVDQSPHNSTASPISTKPYDQVVSRRRPKVFSELMRTSLDKLLEHLLRQLERKDPHEIFTWPVNDIIAPGYSKVIQQPMDFSTMRKKVMKSLYDDVNEFKNDFKLMINNCCTYNRPETIFYESAKKLLSAGLKIMSKDRLLNMKRTLGFLHDLSKTECAQIMGLAPPQEEVTEMAMDVDSAEGDDIAQVEVHIQEEASTEESDFDLRAHPDAVSFTDADNEETVAPDVLEAAKLARERLAQRCPKSKMGFLRIDNVGKTTFNFLNPDPPDETGGVVDLGTLTGRLASGMEALPETKEDKRNKVTPLSYLSYGPFGSFAPSYDSRVANITQEESDLLLAAYGGKTEYLFAKSMYNFVKDSDYDLVNMVDDLLDTLTHGAHKNAIQSIEKKRKKDLEQTKEEPTDDVDQVLQKTIKKEKEEESVNFSTDAASVQEKLDRAGQLVVKLEKTQFERLSEKPPPGASNMKGPSEEEAEIASKLREGLSELISQTKPEDVSSITGIRKAIGVDLNTG